MESSDDSLRNQLAAADPRAFGVLVDRYADRLLAAGTRLLGQREDAEDVVQEVFVAMVRARERLEHVMDLEAYLFTVLRHAAGRCARRRTKGPVTSDVVLSAEARVSDERNSRRDELRGAIRRLPPKQREVIALKIDGELTFAQIGEVLDISPNTAASRYRYALGRLREALTTRSEEANR